MPGTTIGEVNINLRMNLVQFNKDVKDGTDAAGKATQQMGDAIKANSFEARGTLMLLGEEIGVKIPRHLQTMIAGLPGVGAALSSAFTAVAVIAIAEVIFKVVEKLSALREQALLAEAAWKTLGLTTQLEADALRLANDQLEISIEKLGGATPNTLKLLLDQAREAADKLAEAVNKTSIAMDKLLKDQKVGIFQRIFGDAAGTEDAKKVIEDLNTKLQSITDQQAAQIANAKSISEIEKVRADVALKTKDLYAQATEQLQNMLKTSTALQATRGTNEQTALGSTGLDVFGDEKDQSKRITTITALIKQLGAESDKTAGAEQNLGLKLKEGVAQNAEATRIELEKEYSAFLQILKIRDDNADSLTKDIEKKNEEIKKVDELALVWERAHGGISVVANEAREKLEAERQSIEAVLASLKKLLAAGVVPGANGKLPDLTQDVEQPGFAGTSDQLKLSKIKTDPTYAKQVAQQERDAAESVNQKYKEQVAILNELKDKGLLVGQAYTDAMAKATAAVDKGNKAWAQFGTQIGSNILAAAEMKESWGQALTSILEDLLKIILQMEVMKALSSVSGGGGIFGSIVGSLFGGARATGGPVYSGSSYLVGENGPEMFTPGASGRIDPSGSAGGTNITYQIDARGAQAGVSDEIRAALAQTENRAVARAVVTSREIQLRRAS